MAKPLVGLDVGTSAVKVVQLQLAHRGAKLLALGVAPLPPEAIVEGTVMDAHVVVEAIREAITASKIKFKDVVTAIPSRAIIMKTIRLPQMSYEELSESIVWEAEQYIPFPIEDVVLDFQVVSPGDTTTKQMEVLLIAAKKDKVNSHLNLIHDAGLNPVILDVDVFAFSNCYELNAEQAAGEEPIGFIEIGAGLTNISVVKKGIPQFTRGLSLGGSYFTKAIQKAFNLNFDQAEKLKKGGDGKEFGELDILPVMNSILDDLLSEIQRSIEHYRTTIGEFGIAKVVLSGGSSKIPNIDRIFSDKLGVPVEIFNPLRKVEINPRLFNPEQLREMAPMLTVGIGLATRKVGDK